MERESDDALKRACKERLADIGHAVDATHPDYCPTCDGPSWLCRHHMTPEQTRRAMLALSIKALVRPNEPVTPAELALYEMIHVARNMSRRAGDERPAI